MTINFKKIGNVLAMGYVYFVFLFVISALGFQLFFIYLTFSGQDEKASRISNQIMWKIDGTFKNNPDNIWYEGPLESKK
jgi:preprotein translocase subunit SecY